MTRLLNTSFQYHPASWTICLFYGLVYDWSYSKNGINCNLVTWDDGMWTRHLHVLYIKNESKIKLIFSATWIGVIEIQLIVFTIMVMYFVVQLICYHDSLGPKTWTSWLKNLVPICLYCLNCTKFGQLILRKIIEIVATRCQILRLKCTKFNFG